MGINQENFLPDHSIARSAKNPMIRREKLKFRFIILSRSCLTKIFNEKSKKLAAMDERRP